MKKFMTFVLMLFFVTRVSAESICSYKEQATINGKAANIKASHEIKTISHGDEEIGHDEYYFDVNITNVTEDFYIVIKNNVTKEEKKYTSENAKNGIISIKWTEIFKVTNLTIQVFTSNKTQCPNERFKTIYLTLPRYNEYWNRPVCEGNETFRMCKQFVTFDEINEEEFIGEISKYREQQKEHTQGKPNVEEPTLMDNVFEFIDAYKFIIIGGVALVVGVAVLINNRRTKKQRELGL